MNVLTIFDQRINAIFEEGIPGSRPPFAFKRLAKRAVREMEDETFVIDGVDTAPALYTILISQQDDMLMKPLYLQITDEVSQLIEAQAKKRGYTFVGRPLVRFMVDPALRAGRFAVFAENIDPRTLARLRDEENAYLGVNAPQEIYSNQGFVPMPVPVHEEEPAPVAQEVAFAEDVSPLQDFDSVQTEPDVEPDAHNIPDSLGFGRIVEPAAEAFPIAADVSEPNAQDTVEPDPLDIIPEEFAAASTPPDDVPAPVADPKPFAEPVPVAEPKAVANPEPIPAPASPECTLMDLGSGRTYHITSLRAPIGRERVMDGVVLGDPNASRRHAELLFDGTAWVVRDLGSTNGTLVNDVDVPEARLRNGDVLTIGLTNLEFRAG